MSELYAVIGPLATSRPHLAGPYLCGCNSSFSESCVRCDGTDSETYETAAHRREREAREVLPPCMRAGYVSANRRTERKTA